MQRVLPLLVMMAAHVGAGRVDVACTTPEGNEGDIIYNQAYHSVQFCNGTSWQSAAGPGFIQVSEGGSGCSSPVGKEGDIIYNQAYHTPQFCNGTYWIPFAAPASTAPTLPGYFVLSGGTYTGNLGGLSGADAKCLTDLTTNTSWQGYASAYGNGQLVSGKVHALMCGTSTNANECDVLIQPSTTYYFANAGDSTAGGASFTTDAYGYGPGDSANWSGQTYFNTSANYWIDIYGISTIWLYYAYSGNDCSSWTSTSGNGVYGTSNSTTGTRYVDGGTAACTTSEHLLCFVNP